MAFRAITEDELRLVLLENKNVELWQTYVDFAREWFGPKVHEFAVTFTSQYNDEGYDEEFGEINAVDEYGMMLTRRPMTTLDLRGINSWSVRLFLEHRGDQNQYLDDDDLDYIFRQVMDERLPKPVELNLEDESILELSFNVEQPWKYSPIYINDED